MKKTNSKNIVTDYTEYDRIGLKNGWDLPDDDRPPQVGRKKANARAYELLIDKTDDEYIKEAEASRSQREEKQMEKKRQAARFLLTEGRIGYERPKYNCDSEEIIDGIIRGESEVRYENLCTNTEKDILADSENKSRKTAFDHTEAIITRMFDDLKESEEEKLREMADRSYIRNETSLQPTDPSSETSLHGLSAVPLKDWKRRRRRVATVAIIALVLILGSIGARIAFGPAILLADISRYENIEITIEGLKDEPFTITAGELSKMPMVRVSVPVHNGELTKDETPELGKAIGPTLETFLEKYGAATDDFRSMRVYRDNEYSTSYVRTMKEKTMVLSIANGRKPLGEKEAPLRIAVEGEDTGEWTGWVRRIVFTR